MTAEPIAARGGSRRLPGGQGRAALSTADLTESMMSVHGHLVPLDVIARTVHEVLEERVHPRDEPVTRALGREVGRRLRELTYAADPALRPQLSERAQVIARALRGGRT